MGGRRSKRCERKRGERWEQAKSQGAAGSPKPDASSFWNCGVMERKSLTTAARVAPRPTPNHSPRQTLHQVPARTLHPATATVKQTPGRIASVLNSHPLSKK